MSQIIIPSEILRQIFSYLQFRDTKNVSRVSRQWHVWSQEHLYHEIQLIRPLTSHGRLLRTLLTPGSERLATYVRSLTVEWDFVHNDPMDEGVHNDPMDERDVIVARDRAAASLGLRHPVHSLDDQIWLLLHLLPRLDVLTVQPFAEDNRISALIRGMHDTADLPLALRRVHHFSYDADPTADILLAILRLPCIRIIEVWDLYNAEAPFPATHHQTSCVTDLLISHFGIDLPSLGYVLQIPRALTRLMLSGWLPWRNVDLARMKAALEPVRMTLQCLELHIKVYEDSPSVSFLVLSTWPVLRRLWCPLNWLLGKWTDEAELHLEHVLPRSLREFNVYGDYNWSLELVVKELILLVERKKEAVPLLEKVCVEREVEIQIEGEEQLCAVCRDAGVVLEWLGRLTLHA